MSEIRPMTMEEIGNALSGNNTKLNTKSASEFDFIICRVFNLPDTVDNLSFVRLYNSDSGYEIHEISSDDLILSIPVDDIVPSGRNYSITGGEWKGAMLSTEAKDILPLAEELIYAYHET